MISLISSFRDMCHYIVALFGQDMGDHEPKIPFAETCLFTPRPSVIRERLGSWEDCLRTGLLLAAGGQHDQEARPDPHVLADRDRAFRHWEEHCFDHSALQENKQALRRHYHEAKQLGDQVLACH